ncbi:Hypothetical protein NAEGRDRAFT_80204 [Naegleria gruberi]|uniref:Uncharacterized protein n=1 Tax=Naegleria gruberi TaxID=5762 RepID=D2VJL2_NAEGR|nr:uncharacterized protein NAEGRDRAFT_80204 [Naegleria gruberi]EFC42968.1 Hypothetical protein NAEGRDRAFT_80204 [Naegleria gruberi]|eukprot:XP_002675712.1 Hypothetical protein NAEGRDRAFT_80204 [Naegleria gruberi strain NEG-M]
MAHLEKAVVIEDDVNHEQQQTEEEFDSADWAVSTKKQRGGRKQKGVAPTSVQNTVFGSSMTKKKPTTTTTTSTTSSFSGNLKKKTPTDKKSTFSTDKTIHPPHYTHERSVEIPARVDPRFLVGEKGSFSNEVKKQTGITWYSVKNMKVVIGGASEESVAKAEELVIGRLNTFSMTHFSETFSTLVIPELKEQLDSEDSEIENIGTEYDIVLKPFTSLAVYSSQPNHTFKRMVLKKEGDAEEVTEDKQSTATDLQASVMNDAHDVEANASGEHNTHHKEMTLMNEHTKADMLEKIAHKLVDIEMRKNDSEILSVKALYGQLLAFKSTKDSLKIFELLELKHGRDVKYHFNRIVEGSFYEKLKSNLKYIPDEDATIVAIYFGKQVEKEEDGQQVMAEKNETITFEVNKSTGKLEQIKKNEHTRNYYTLNYVTPITKGRTELNDFKITIASYVPNEVEQDEKKAEIDSFLSGCINTWDNQNNTLNTELLKNPPSPYRFKGTIVKFKKHYHSEDGAIKVTLHEIHDLDTKAINYEVVVVSEELYRYLDDKELKPADKKKKYKESLEKLTDWLFTNQ